MRKMAKGTAITGAVFCILSMVTSLFSMITTISSASRYGNPEVVTSLLLSNIPGVLVFLFLAIVLFRRKADVFAGVIFILLGVYALVNVVSVAISFPIITRGGMSPIPYICGMAGNLFRGVVYILMAVHCFRKNAGKTPLYGIGFIVVALLATAQTVTLMTANGAFYGDTAMAVIALIPAVIGCIIGALPLILAGFAVGNAKAATPVDPADPYGLYAKYGIQPQYQVPQQGNWQQPQYQAPQQQTWQQPQYQQPQQQTWQQPQYQAPQQQTWQQPQYQQPQYQAPQQENERN